MTVDILLTVYEGTPYLREQLHSLQSQSHPDWRLWVRDDGSTDSTVEEVRWFASRDERIHLLSSDGERIGAPRGFGWLLERLPDDARYVMFCDQDDYWRADKIAVTLEAMREAEAREGEARPLLVHTDLSVVDRHLNPLHESFWRYQNLDPAKVTLRSLLVENTVSGCAAMLNRALVDLAGPIPPEAVMHDWWSALVAVRFGKIVPVHEATIMYRQHDRNNMGAKRVRPPRGWRQLLERARSAIQDPHRLRSDIHRSAAQARAFHDRFAERLSPAERDMVRRYAEIPDCGLLKRKLRVAVLRTLPEHGFARNLGTVLRG